MDPFIDLAFVQWGERGTAGLITYKGGEPHVIFLLTFNVNDRQRHATRVSARNCRRKASRPDDKTLLKPRPAELSITRRLNIHPDDCSRV